MPILNLTLKVAAWIAIISQLLLRLCLHFYLLRSEHAKMPWRVCWRWKAGAVRTAFRRMMLEVRKMRFLVVFASKTIPRFFGRANYWSLRSVYCLYRLYCALRLTFTLGGGPFGFRIFRAWCDQHFASGTNRQCLLFLTFPFFPSAVMPFYGIIAIIAVLRTFKM